MRKLPLLSLALCTIVVSGCVTNKSQTSAPEERPSIYSSLLSYLVTDTKLGWLMAWREEVAKNFHTSHIEITPYNRNGGYCPQSLNANSARSELQNRVKILCGMSDGTYNKNGWCIRQQDKIPLFYFSSWINERGPCFTTRGTIPYVGYFPPNQDDYTNTAWINFYQSWLEKDAEERAQTRRYEKNKSLVAHDEEERIKEETKETLSAKPGTLLCRRVPLGNNAITRGYKIGSRKNQVNVQYTQEITVNGLNTYSQTSRWDDASEWYRCTK